MLAVFGMPYVVQMLVIGLICLMLVGVSVVIIAVVLLVTRKNRGDR